MIFCFLSLLYICTYSDAISEVLSRRLAADREAKISGFILYTPNISFFLSVRQHALQNLALFSP